MSSYLPAVELPSLPCLIVGKHSCAWPTLWCPRCKGWRPNVRQVYVWLSADAMTFCLCVFKYLTSCG